VYFESVIEATATDMARAFHQFLGKVEHGETVLIRRHGKTVARLVPDSAFMSGKEAANLFRMHHASDLDRATADAITAQINKLDTETDALAH
jgi:antitoxin (DNA-binding transcriptional repressor) of toxin-antitoxin stability system